MTKRLLAVFLCLCLLIPTMGLSLAQTASAEEEYVIATIPYQISGTYKGGGTLFSTGTSLSPIDLSPYGVDVTGGGAIPRKKVGLSLDVYIGGESAGIRPIVNGGLSGQIELCSGGTCDVGERGTYPNAIKWKADEWNRCVIDLSTFTSVTDTTGKTPFNSKAINYFRIYLNAPASTEGYSFTMKIRNVKLVNLQAEPLDEEEDPLGDGSFVPDEPEWKQYTVAEGYNNDDVIVAGYNAAEYVKDHSIEVKDWAPIFNSLIEGLSAAGGGALFIPAGEYDCYSPIVMLTGVSIYGEWKNPDENPKIEGTIIKVHEECGAGSSTDTPFLTMNRDGLIKNLAFWYPDQSATSPVAYPPTISLDQYNHAKNITLVNSYWGVVRRSSGANCPNVENIYGTPLFCGLDIDIVIDIMRIENVNFAADYWINSGLEGAPTGEDDQAALRNYLLYNGTGVILRRIDWSYFVYSRIKGYATGLAFARSGDGSNFPNGQCNTITFEDCRYGVYAESISGTGEMITNSHFINCENGIVLGEGNFNSASVLQIVNTEIEASSYAIRNQQVTTVMLMSSTIHSGEVGGTSGWYVITDNTFETEAPQVVLENGSLNAVLVGNFDKDGKAIEVDNQGLCPIEYDATALDTPEVPVLSIDEISFVPHKPAKEMAYIIDTLDATGKTDVTKSLQAALDSAAKQGGGVVYLVSGTYRVDGSVTVPSGVELRGACDFGRVPYNVGTIIAVTDECGTDPTVILSEKSGIRGVVFHYPDQYYNTLFQKEKKFTAYPYAMQGRGADIYVINVAFHNGWDGLDMMTYKCDNHYIDYLCGECLHNDFSIGKGAKDGIIRNYQFNYNAIFQASGYGWGNLPLERDEFEDIMQEQLDNHDDMTVLTLGHVENELIYNSFNYSGYAGIRFIAEDTGAADVTIVGHGCDYSTIDFDILAAERIIFLNTQLTAFNQIGDMLQHPMYVVHLGPDFEGQVDMISTVMWADSTQEFCAESGTLNLYGVIMAPYHSTVQMTNVTGDGKICMTNAFFKNNVTTMASAGTENVFVNGGITYQDIVDADKLGQYDNMIKRVESWDAPANAQFADGATMWFTDAFTDAEKVTFKASAGGDASVSFKSGQATLNMGTNTGVGITNASLNMVAGEEDALYHLETRLNMSMFHKDGNARVMLSLFDNDSTPCYPVTFNDTGKVILEDGSELADYETDTWYRVALDIDLRDPVNKTYQVVLMDNDYNELAKSDVIPFAEDFQDARLYFKQIYIGAIADQAASAEDTTDRTIVKCDYVFVTRGGSTGTPGDVNGDDKIDSTDARLILQYYAKKIGEDGLNLAAADVDGSGTIDSTDARLILQYYAKKISEF